MNMNLRGMFREVVIVALSEIELQIKQGLFFAPVSHFTVRH